MTYADAVQFEELKDRVKLLEDVLISVIDVLASHAHDTAVINDQLKPRDAAALKALRTMLATNAE